MIGTEGKHLVVRADGGTSIGLGHVVRSLALAEQMRRSGWEVTLLSGPLPALVEQQAESAGIAVRQRTAEQGGRADAVETVASEPDLIVVDGYHFGADFFACLDAGGWSYAVIADGETAALQPAVLVDQNPNAVASSYAHVAPSTALLLGLRYALIREEIRRGRAPRGPDSRATRYVFLSLGGSDPRLLSHPLAVELTRRGAAVRLALGDAVERRSEVVSNVERLDNIALVERSDFVPVFAGAALATIGAGTTMWEAALLGVPAVALVVADNQAEPSAAAEALGFVLRAECRSHADPTLLADTILELFNDPQRLATMAQAGKAAVDGRGCERVGAQLTRLAMQGSSA